jgi:hypothetical protein
MAVRIAGEAGQDHGSMGRILAQGEKHVDELIGWWFHFPEDFNRGRLRRDPGAP